MSEASEVTNPIERIVMVRTPVQVANSLTEYWATYNTQPEVDGYTQGIVIDDALYGLGLAINPELFKEADGYARFKELLKAHLAA